MAEAVADPLRVSVPPDIVAELKAEVAAELGSADADEMIAALGGDPRCFERFLVARALNVSAASDMLRDTLRFRSQEVAPIDPEVRSKVACWWPGANIGRTADGKPLQFVRIGKLDPRGLYATVTEQEFRSYYIHWMELSLRHQVACSGSQIVEIYDLQGLSFSQLHVGALRMLARVLKIGQDHYMESLHRCIIFNAPKVFAIAWSIISTVLNERTRAKTLILSNDGRECLQEVLGLERDEIERLLSKNYEDDKEGLAWLPAPPVSTPPVSVS